MAAKIIVGFLLLVVIGIGLIFIDRPFVRFVLTAKQTDDSDPWVQVKNDGAWDATSFSFGCAIIEAKDAAGRVVIPRRANVSFLTAQHGDLAVNESRQYSCALASEGLEKIATAEMRGFAIFGVRYLPLSRARQYRILLQRGDNNRFQITGIHSD